MMAATTTGAVKFCQSGRLKHTEKRLNTTKLALYSSTSVAVSRASENFYVRALDPRTEQEVGLVSSSPTTDSITSQEMMRPNLVQALTMIWTPVVGAVWLLIKQSPAEEQR